MTTSEERREVARKLREAKSSGPWFVPSYELDEVADLIDPTCVIEENRGETDPYPSYSWEWKLSCGHVVRTAWDDPPSYCPECGARVVRKEDDGDR